MRPAIAPRSSHHRAVTATSAATAPGTTSTSSAAGRLIAAAPETATSRTSINAPSRNRRRASSPATAASTSTPAITEPIRIGLSLLPNCRMAHSFIGVGVRSITVEPDREHRRGVGVEQGGNQVAGGNADQGRQDPEGGVQQTSRHGGCSEQTRSRIGAAG